MYEAVHSFVSYEASAVLILTYSLSEEEKVFNFFPITNL